MAVVICSFLLLQIEWKKYSYNPVLKKDTIYPSWDCGNVADPTVILDNDTFKIWYTGAGLDSLWNISPCQIGYAWSLDGINWTKYPRNPVFSPSESGWDSDGIETVCVLKDTTAPDSERYKMWYCGYDTINPYKIGYAVSPDGIHWSRYPSPVLEPGPELYDCGSVWNPMVLIDGDTFRMWYPSFGVEIVGTETLGIAPICYAWSLDGINWTKYPGNPVLAQGDTGSWDDVWVCEPSVLKRDSIYEMWYSGAEDTAEPGEDVPTRFSTGYATSSDGIHWTKHGIVLERGAPGEWDAHAAFAVTVILDDTLYKMWYTGIDTLPAQQPTWYWDIGYAWAPVTGIEEAQSSKLKTQNFILTAHPNPFTGKTVIKLNVRALTQRRQLQELSLQIYGLAGRVVKSFLINQSTNSLVHSIIWDGRDNAGRKVPSGIYFVTLKIGYKFLQTTKFVLLR